MAQLRLESSRWFVPGRVELLGKHVDYLGGRSLTCATPWGLDITAHKIPGDRGFVGIDDVYSRAVLRRLQRDFGQLPNGVRLNVVSSLPAGAGLSSSSAWILGLCAALAWANDLPERASWRDSGLGDALALAEYAGAVESGSPWRGFAGDDGVGTQGGAQDHVAIVANESGRVGQFSYLPARREAAADWPAQWQLLLLHSGVVANKAGAALASFNRVAAEGRAGGWERRSQFLRECEVLVPAARAAIAAADAVALRAAVQESQQAAERVLRNQIPETVSLVQCALAAGAWAASSFGAGFGGAVWAVARAGEATAVLGRWCSAYVRQSGQGGREPWSGVMAPAAGMRRLPD